MEKVEGALAASRLQDAEDAAAARPSTAPSETSSREALNSHTSMTRRSTLLLTARSSRVLGLPSPQRPGGGLPPVVAAWEEATARTATGTLGTATATATGSVNALATGAAAGASGLANARSPAGAASRASSASTSAAAAAAAVPSGLSTLMALADPPVLLREQLPPPPCAFPSIASRIAGLQVRSFP
jgi:hypothetical protein